MLEKFKQWMQAAGLSPIANTKDAELHRWAHSQRLTLSYAGKSGEELVFRGQGDEAGLCLEWGSSQRYYIEGAELRVRLPLRVSDRLQWLCMDRRLRRALEREVFEEYVEDVRTRIETRTPPEMRWLVMLPKVDLDWGEAWRDQFDLVSNDPDWAVRQLGPDWARETLKACQTTAGCVVADKATDPTPSAGLTADSPVPTVISISRQTMQMRTRLDAPHLHALGAWLAWARATMPLGAS